MTNQQPEYRSKATANFPEGTILSTVSQEEADQLMEMFEEAQKDPSKKEEPTP